jgi:hypothetical protein
MMHVYITNRGMVSKSYEKSGKLKDKDPPKLISEIAVTN